MSAKHDGEGFLSRWSRLKRSEEQSQPTNKVGATGQEPAAADAQIPAADEPSLADLTKLPRLDELTSGSDFAAFRDTANLTIAARAHLPITANSAGPSPGVHGIPDV